MSCDNFLTISAYSIVHSVFFRKKDPDSKAKHNLLPVQLFPMTLAVNAN